MIKQIAGLMLTISTCAASPTVTISATSYISHSAVQIVASISSSFNSARSRVAISPATCSRGAGGVVQPMGIHPRFGQGRIITMNVTGLMAGTTYNICPEVSDDYDSPKGNRGSWSSGASVTITTLALPAVHPALPIKPATYDTSYPDTNGYEKYTLNSKCTDIGVAYAAARARQAVQGTVIYIPAGTVCDASLGNYDFALKPVDVQTWGPSKVELSASQIALGGSPKLKEGQGVRFGFGYTAGSSYPSSTSCEFGQGLQSGQVYYVHVVDAATNTVTLKCGDRSTPVMFTTRGVDRTGGSQGFYWVPAERDLKWIILRSAAPDSQLPPEHIQITPAWRSKMATFRNPLRNLGLLSENAALIAMGTNDPNQEIMTSHIRIGPGIEITTSDSPESHTSFDPTPWFTLVWTFPWNDNIVFDRTYWHFPGSPNRDNNGFRWDGYKTGVVDSYFENLVYFHSEYNGLLTTQTSKTTFTVGAGVENMGGGNVHVEGPRTVTLTGKGTGMVFVGLDMMNNNAFTIWTPQDLKANCDGIPCANKIQGGASTGSCDHNDNWPRNTSGNPSVGPISCVKVLDGSIVASTPANATFSKYWTEGIQFMIGGLGPGPYVAINNFISGAGLIWHHDDAGVYSRLRGDYTYLRNYFEAPLRFLYNRTNPLSDGLSYYMRQPLEWKGGRRIQINGNVFDGHWNETEGSSSFILLTSVNGMGITDVDMQNNTFMHGPGVASTCFLTSGSGEPMTPPCSRWRFQNNLAWDIGSAYWSPHVGALAATGWLHEGPNSAEDLIENHNTFVANTGSNPAVFWLSDSNVEGVSVTNNIFYIDPSRQGLAQDGSVPSFGTCGGLTGKALATCKFTPNYIWEKNLMIGNGEPPSAVHAAWPGLSNFFQDAPSSLGKVGWVNYQQSIFTNGNPAFLDFHLKPGSQMGDVGADMDELEKAQGAISIEPVSPAAVTETSAAITYMAADSENCYVDYSNTDPQVISRFNRIADHGGERRRSTSLTGLSPHTLYYYRVECQGNSVLSQKMGTVTTK